MSVFSLCSLTFIEFCNFTSNIHKLREISTIDMYLWFSEDLICYTFKSFAKLNQKTRQLWGIVEKTLEHLKRTNAYFSVKKTIAYIQVCFYQFNFNLLQHFSSWTHETTSDRIIRFTVIKSTKCEMVSETSDYA